MTPKKRVLKIIILGDIDVGKTSLIHRYVNKRYSGEYKATIGTSLMTKEVVIGNIEITMQVSFSCLLNKFLCFISVFAILMKF